MIKLAAVGSPLGLPGRGTDVDQTWNSRGSDVELTWIRCGTVCGRAVSSVGRAVEPVDETPDPRRAIELTQALERDSM